MKRTWRIRAFQKGDEHQILRLRKIVFGDLDPVRLNLSIWYWQFRDNPAGEAFCCLAEDKGVIVGQYTAIPTRFHVHGQETIFAFSCDTMTHPAYRNQGMFVALADELYRSMESRHQITTIWGFPNEVSLHGFTDRLGWKVLAVFPFRVMPIRPLAILRKYISFLNRQTTYPEFSELTHKPLPVSPRKPGLLVEPINHFDRAFDELWQRHKGLAPIMQVRDSLYLNWRYLAIPEFSYQPLAVRWKGDLTGYMVIRLMNLMGYYFGVVADLFPFPVVDYAITKYLLRFARDYCKARGAQFMTCLLSEADASFLKSAGLRKIPEKLNPKRWYFGSRFSEGDRSLLEPIGHWYITYGDTDIV